MQEQIRVVFLYEELSLVIIIIIMIIMRMRIAKASRTD